MLNLRNVYTATALSFTQVLGVADASADTFGDGTNGLIGRVNTIIGKYADGKPIQKNVVGIVKDGATAASGVANIVRYQEAAKSSTVSDEQLRSTLSSTLGGVKAFGGVLTALIIAPFERVGGGNAVADKNEFSLADALINRDSTRIETAARKLEESRKFYREQPKLQDPTLDILVAGTSGKVRTALQVIQPYVTIFPKTSRSQEPNAAFSSQTTSPISKDRSAPFPTSESEIEELATAQAPDKWTFISLDGTENEEKCAFELDTSNWKISLQNQFMMTMEGNEYIRCDAISVAYDTEDEYLSRLKCLMYYGSPGGVKTLGGSHDEDLFIAKKHDEFNISHKVVSTSNGYQPTETISMYSIKKCD